MLNTNITNDYYSKKQTDTLFTILDGSIYTQFTTDGWVRRFNRLIIMHVNINTGTLKAGQWVAIATLSDGVKPDKSLLCNCNGYQGGWSDPTPVAAMIDTNGKIFIYSQNSKLTNFTISTVWFTIK